MKNNIINIGYRERANYFTLDQAKELLPLIRKITHQSYSSLDPIRSQLRKMTIVDTVSKEMESSYKFYVLNWIEKMNRLGVLPQTLGVVNFDTGDGYLNWKYPELSVNYYYEYEGHYSERLPLERVIFQQSYDWAR